MNSQIKVGTRGSRLALWQTEWVVSRLRAQWPEVDFSVQVIRTTGDHVQDVALSRIGDRGLFTRELDRALLEGRIDFAVHSMKDVPTALPEGLCIAAVTERADPRDALIGRGEMTLGGLPEGAVVATGSLRRRAQLLHLRPDLKVVDIRGNVPTRLEKFDASDWQAMVLAVAGLQRLGLENRISEYLPPEVMLPAVGQGSFAIVTRSQDRATRELVSVLDHFPSRCAIQAERALLRQLQGGCQVPIGALAQVVGEQLFLQAFVSDLEGRRLIRNQLSGTLDEPDALGETLARWLLEAGGAEILAEIRANQASGSA